MKNSAVPETAFRIRNGKSERPATLFRPAGAPGCFQILLNDISRPYLDKFVLVYLGEILTYNKIKHKYSDYLKIVLLQKRAAERKGKVENSVRQEVDPKTAPRKNKSRKRESCRSGSENSDGTSSQVVSRPRVNIE